MPIKDEEFKRLFEEGDAAYRRSREALKDNPHRPTRWEEITPPQLKPAIEYLRKEFAASTWQISTRAECACYLGLHPHLALQPKFKGGLENLVPLNRRSEWQRKYAGVSESETFKFWSDEFSEELAELIVVPFDAFLKIGLAQKSVLKLPPIEWAEALTDDLIYGLEWTLPRLIKNMCDEQENRLDLMKENFLGYCAWVYWRAPRLLYMQPSGSTVFDPVTAWERENAANTEDILKSLSGRMLDGVRARLIKLAGDAHVLLASTSPMPTPPTEDRGPEPHLDRLEQLADQIKPANLTRSLKQPAPRCSCFISYSSKDQEFADRLYADLQANGVECWFAPEDLKIGDPFRQHIDDAIRRYDKLLVVLSETSVASTWVESEVEAALERERAAKGETVLFPIRLDEAVMKTSQAWAADIRRKRHMGDFSLWQDHTSYQKAFQRLLRDLQGTKTE
jgi:hypothetical protein